MNQTKIEGTLVLDGLLEGKIPQTPGAEDRIREWVDFAKSLGLNLSIQIDGNSFNILGINKPSTYQKLGPDPAEKITELLEKLLNVFPPQERRGVFSTLRSMEFRGGQEIQTAYLISGDGGVLPRQRTVEAETTRSEAPLSRREKIMMAVVALVLVAGAVGVMFWIFPNWFSQTIDQMTPLDVKDMEVDLGEFADYLVVEKKEKAKIRAKFLLTLKKTDKYPSTPEQLQTELKAEVTVQRRLALEALARGYIRIELFDKKDKYMTSVEVRIKQFTDKGTLLIALPYMFENGPKGRATRFVLTY